jgi:hypothetical protein
MEELREFGWRKEYSSLATLRRVFRKLASGKAERRKDR